MSGYRKLRLLFVTAHYLPSLGGTEIHVFEVARRLVDAGHRVKVLTPDWTAGLPAREEHDGVEVQRVRGYPRRGDLQFSPELFRSVRSASADLVHLHGYYSLVGPFAMAAAIRSDLPFVLTLHGRGHSAPLRRRLRRLQELALRPLLIRAAGLVALTESEHDFYRRTLRLPNSLVCVIPGGADLTDMADLPDSPVDRDLIVSLGRVERLKGHHKLVAALPLIRAARPNVRLLICGEGPYERELRRLAEELGVADRVEIAGIPFSRRNDFVQTLRRAAVVVSLSESEAQGLAALEAAFLGRPLVLSASSGLKELVATGSAVGVPANAPSTLIADAVLKQLEHPIPPTAARLPTWRECAARLEELYLSVIERRR